MTATNPSHYYGTTPSIQIIKYTNGEDADTVTGPFIPVGGAVNWTYAVTNTGNVTLTNVGVTDDQGVIVSCPASELAPGAGMVCAAMTPTPRPTQPIRSAPVPAAARALSRADLKPAANPLAGPK